jgi:hypothetical protein
MRVVHVFRALGRRWRVLGIGKPLGWRLRQNKRSNTNTLNINFAELALAFHKCPREIDGILP